MKKKLIPGKRYWFRDRGYVYSGLFGGEIDDRGLVILHRRNGDEWAIPLEDVYATAKEARGDMQYCKVVN